jgi:hypothetical protein
MISLDPAAYLFLLHQQVQTKGDQSLLMPEIMCLLLSNRIKKLWLPYSLGRLAPTARAFGIEVFEQREVPPPSFDALYFGTPTIVKGKKLFENSAEGDWDMKREQSEVRALCALAYCAKARLIISGLGSGDIPVSQRCRDMQLPGWRWPQVVVEKNFDNFQDWVIATEIES